MKLLKIQPELFKAFALVFLLTTFCSAIAQDENAKNDTLKIEQKLINVAYGTQSADAVTSSISTVKFDDLKGISTSVSQAYTGRLPGLTKYGIRGLSTQTGNNQPLVIIDGFKSSFEFLSINEIESISILKDALATALYGMEAANGVILVTTRSGKGDKRNITVDAGYSASVLNETADLLNAREYAELRNQAVINDNFYNQQGSYQPPFPDPSKYDGSDPYKYPDNNYLNELYSKIANNYYLGLRVDGGLKSVRYLFNAYYSGYGGSFKRDMTDEAKASTQNYSNTLILRGKVDVDVTKNLTVLTNAKFALLSENSPAISPVQDALSLPPQEFPIYNPNGTLGASVQNPQRNPVGQLGYSGRQSYMKRNVSVNVNVKYSFDDWIKGLSFEVRGGLDSWFRLVDVHSTKIPSYIFNPVDSSYTLAIDQKDLGVVTWNGAPYNNNQLTTLESSLNYNRTFGNHSFNLMLLSHFDQYVISYDYYKFKTKGYGIRAAYGFRNKYFAEFAGNYNGQEAFSPDDNYGFFPSVGLSWITSKESFMDGVKDVVNYLKIRGSYGIVGGTGFSPPDMNRFYKAGIGSGTTSYGYYLNNRIYYNQYFNSNASAWTFGKIGGDVSGGSGAALDKLASIVTWDKSYKLDLAIEATLINHLKPMFNYFADRREGFLTNSVTNVSYVSGVYYRVPFTNYGSVENKGFETSLEFFDDKGDFVYSVTGSFWYNNCIIKEQSSINELFPTISYNGQNLLQIYGYQSAGFYSKNTPKGTNQGFGEVVPGDVIYVDQNSDNIINELDLIPIGNPDTKYYSLSLYFGYKRFFVDAMITGNFSESRLMSGFEIPFSQPYENAYSYAKESWTPENADKAKYPRLSNSFNINNSQPSDLWIRSTSRFDLNYVQIGYNAPKLWEKFKGDTKIYLQAQNPLAILKYDDRTYSASPWYKHYGIGMNIKF